MEEDPCLWILPIASLPCPFDGLESDYFVHLGNQDFFHVKTGTNYEFYKIQYICITTFQIICSGRWKTYNQA
ncbi:hypothetical protein PRUPE_3G199300 [Prunus persica]|uniref:Uncharacterized protein n=1 Tax=Prunus persica TaxID=3760 RepID=A0A251Q657_PRUPE|nr:hypothetical protein PRUPE_3G199300 [Prunus persica]